MAEWDQELVRKTETLPGFGHAPSPAEVAWAAGLFEGEGWIGAPSPSSTQTKRYVRASLSSTDIDVLQRFQRLMGGTVYGPQKRVPGRKPIWTWHVTRKASVDEFVTILYPWLGARRQWQVRESYLRVGRALPFEEGV